MRVGYRESGSRIFAIYGSARSSATIVLLNWRGSPSMPRSSTTKSASTCLCATHCIFSLSKRMTSSLGVFHSTFRLMSSSKNPRTFKQPSTWCGLKGATPWPPCQPWCLAGRSTSLAHVFGTTCLVAQNFYGHNCSSAARTTSNGGPACSLVLVMSPHTDRDGLVPSSSVVLQLQQIVHARSLVLASIIS